VKTQIISLMKSWGIDLFTIKHRIKSRKYFLTSRAKFLELGGEINYDLPIWTDRSDEAGMINGHYFHQDLMVASLISQSSPIRHIDIGSRIDGFVAHLATFRKIEIIDIRPLKQSIHSNIQFSQLDLMSSHSQQEITDSLSCLHAIEHFVLGRYGDPINPNGHLIGFKNMVSLLKSNGTFYISFPITSSNTKVYFNAHRVFNYLEIFSWPGQEDLVLKRFDFVDDRGDLFMNQDINNFSFEMIYGCGIYTFVKL